MQVWLNLQQKPLETRNLHVYPLKYVIVIYILPRAIELFETMNIVLNCFVSTSLNIPNTARWIQSFNCEGNCIPDRFTSRSVVFSLHSHFFGGTPCIKTGTQGPYKSLIPWYYSTSNSWFWSWQRNSLKNIKSCHFLHINIKISSPRKPFLWYNPRQCPSSDWCQLWDTCGSVAVV